MSSRDPKDDQTAGTRQGGNVETKGASQAPPSGNRDEQNSGADEDQPSTGEG